ncbi:50S ribosomal protein L3 [bioreactor metagenome]
MGNEKVTVLNLEVVKVDVERNALLLKGAIPGPKKGLVKIREAVRKSK